MSVSRLHVVPLVLAKRLTTFRLESSPFCILDKCIMNNSFNSKKVCFQTRTNPVFKVAFWNAGGLTNDKFSELKVFIVNNNIDIMGIAECGASTNKLDYFGIPGYQIFCLERSRQIASGIIVYVKCALAASVLLRRSMTANDKLEVIRVRVWLEAISYYVTFVYNPPLNKPKLEDLLCAWNKSSIILGDFNAHSRRWGYTDNNTVGNIVEDFIDSNPVVFIDNLTNSPTFLSYGGGSSHPDLLLSHPGLEKNIGHVLRNAPGGAGHQILLATIQGTHSIYRPPRCIRWNLKKANWNTFAKLTDIHVRDLPADSSIDRIINAFCNALLKCASLCIPRGRMKRYSPFWNSNLQDLKEKRDDARKKAERTGQREDCIALRKSQAVLRKAIIEYKRITYRSFLENLDFRRDGIRAHRFLSRLNNQKEPKNEPLRVGSKFLTTTKEKARAFCKHFAKISNYHPQLKIKNSELVPPTVPRTSEFYSLFCDDFTQIELDMGLNGLVKGRSPGPDGILPEFLLFLGPLAKNTLLRLINLAWRRGLPSIWRKAEVIPILKPNKDPQCLSSYRPISLTSVLCKLTERLISNRLNFILERRRVLSECQAGFRKRRNTSEQIVRLSQEIKDGFQRKLSTIAVFVDFKTAFDTVWRKKLLTKLIAYDIGGNIYSWIKSFLDQRFLRAKYENTSSEYRQIRQGLPQGSVLSPLLFNLMINDFVDTLHNHVPGVQTLLFADDMVIWTTGRDFGSMERTMQRALMFLEGWSNENEMTVNPDKTTFQLFSLSTKHHDINLRYNNQILLRTEKTTYLGLDLDSKLNWSGQIKKAVDRGDRRAALLKRLAGTTWGATQDVLCTAYKTYVRPAVEYGSEALITISEANALKLDIFQNRIMRFITGGTKSTPITTMELQTGLEPLRDRRYRMALNLAETILRRSDNFMAQYWPAVERLKTQRTYLSCIKDLHDTLDLPFSDRLPFPDPWCPLKNYKLATGYVELVYDVGKKYSLDSELKYTALTTIHERFPGDSWIHVYTDGSAEGATKNAGAGVYSADFALSSAVGKHFDNFDGELAAISLALDEIKQFENKNIVFFIDSRAAILTLTTYGHCECGISKNCKEKIDRLLGSGNCIALQWIPSHCGIHGNERADELAKKGSQMAQPDPPLPLRHIKRLISFSIKSIRLCQYREDASGKIWNSLLNKATRIPNSLPRAVGVACFRLATGHDYLQKHLFRIGLTDTDACPLCETDVPMTGDHLCICPAVLNCVSCCTSDSVFDVYFNRSSMYWAARRLMTERSETGIG